MSFHFYSKSYSKNRKIYFLFFQKLLFTHNINRKKNYHYHYFFHILNSFVLCSRYKFALACIKLKKNKEGEKALLGDIQSIKFNVPIQQQIDKIPNGAYGLYLLGLIYER